MAIYYPVDCVGKKLYVTQMTDKINKKNQSIDYQHQLLRHDRTLCCHDAPHIPFISLHALALLPF